MSAGRWVRLVALVLAFAASAARAEEPPPDSGRWLFFVDGRRAGEETWKLTRTADGLSLSASSRVETRAAASSRDVTLETATDFTPRRLRLTARPDPDLTVEIGALTTSWRRGKSVRKLPARPRSFPIAGPIPVSVPAVLLRWTQRKGPPGPIALLPSGEARIELRGRDPVTTPVAVTLDRWSVRGIAPGNTTLWSDAAGLVALAARAAGSSRFLAVREGWEAMAPFFEEKALREGIDVAVRGALSVSTDARKRVVIFGGRLVDGTGRPPISHAIVVLEGDRIAAAGPVGKVKIPKGVSLMDATGKTILPGLWDASARLETAEDAALLFASGVTSAIAAGTTLEPLAILRDAAEAAPRSPLPSLRLAIAAGVDRDAPGEEERRALLERCASLRCTAALLGPRLRDDDRAALVPAAREKRLSVLALVSAPWTSAVAPDAFVLAPGKPSVSSESIRALRRGPTPLVAGTGAAGGVARAAELLVAAGASPAQAIRALTAIPAQIAGETNVGTVEPGKRADLLLVEGNAGRSIQALRKPSVVIARGRAMNPKLLLETLGLR